MRTRRLKGRRGRIFSGLYLVVTTIHVAIRLRTGDANTERVLGLPSLILFGITVLASVANVLGFGGAYAFSLYLTNILLGIGSPLYGILLMWDGALADFQKITICKSPACAVCGEQA